MPYDPRGLRRVFYVLHARSPALKLPEYGAIITKTTELCF